MATISVTIDGIEYDLSNTFNFLGHDSLGMPAQHRLAERAPQQHGQTDRGFRLDARTFRLYFGLDGSDIADLYDKREQFLRLFKPSNQVIRVTFSLDNGYTRRIDAHYNGDINFASADKQGFYLRAVVALVAPDPTLYNPVEQAEVFALGAGGGAFAVPMEVPLAVGASVLNVNRVVDYAGSWVSYPFIRIVGPITSAKVYNVTTGEQIYFGGVTIDAGDYYDVDCRYGQKTVVDSEGNNKIGDLSTDSDLGTFHLEAPQGLATSLPNDIQVTGSGVTSATEVYLRYAERFIGI